jgi:hypothetical protein
MPAGYQHRLEKEFFNFDLDLDFDLDFDLDPH